MGKPKHNDGAGDLCMVLYGEDSAAMLLGGSDAPILHDAAKEIDELRSILIDTISQACHDGPNGALDSCALTAYADAIRMLKERGYVIVENEYGRRVIAHLNLEKVRELEDRREERRRAGS